MSLVKIWWQVINQIRTDCYYDKENISVVICETTIPLQLTSTFYKWNFQTISLDLYKKFFLTEMTLTLWWQDNIWKHEFFNMFVNKGICICLPVFSTGAMYLTVLVCLLHFCQNQRIQHHVILFLIKKKHKLLTLCSSHDEYKPSGTRLVKLCTDL